MNDGGGDSRPHPGTRRRPPRPPADRQPAAILAADPGMKEGNSGCGFEEILGAFGSLSGIRLGRIAKDIRRRSGLLRFGIPDQGSGLPVASEVVVHDRQTSCDKAKSRTIRSDKKRPSFSKKMPLRPRPVPRGGGRAGRGKLDSIP